MDRFESLSKIAQDEFGVTIKSKSPTGETFESLYCKTKDNDGREKQIEEEGVNKNTYKTADTSLGYMNMPQHLSDKEWKLICESFTRTIELAKMRGTAFFSCPTHLLCKICPLKGFCQKAVYPAEMWEKLEKQWKAQYEDDNEEGEKEDGMK